MYLGMLSVSPGAQASGIGKEFLSASEKYALAEGCHSIIMNVISLRVELISWYERHGYMQTGETKPFPNDTKFGTPKHPIEFIVLEKKLGG
jgi:ribosomal protein S18 acetylase RimI-like enzyme